MRVDFINLSVYYVNVRSNIVKFIGGGKFIIMNPEVLAKYIKDKPLTYRSADGSVEVYGKLNLELLVKRLLKSKYITGEDGNYCDEK